MKNESVILGVMSGTSLDGIDLALCKFSEDENRFSYKIIKTEFSQYDADIKTKLSKAQKLDTLEFIKFHKSFGSYLGNKINLFLTNAQKPDYIASHGHTVFHNPNSKLTFQIGDGAFIAAKTNISVISDFRNLDSALGGQGAPLVPIGDKYLFPEYDFCINLGGFANISFDINEKRIAYDICPLNFILNKYSEILGYDFDKGGMLGQKGNVNIKLLELLNDIPYYKHKYPKSLARENVEEQFFPIFENFNISINDKIRTYYEHTVDQILINMKSDIVKKVLFTGGGTYNDFLISEIKKRCQHDIIIPDNQIIDFKEAIIFAFLGFLKIIKKYNTLASVTGARKDSCGGSIFDITD